MADRHHDTGGAVRVRWFAGVTRNGVILVALACLASGLRRIDPFAFEWLPVVEGFVKTGVYMGVTMLAVAATINRVPPTPRWRYTALALVIPVSTISLMMILNLVELGGYAPLRAAIAESGGIGWWIFFAMLHYGVIAMLFATVFVFYRLREEREAATRDAELERNRSEQQMDEARLQTLQAQIEPHFLFNTLANVRRLYQTEPDAAAAMLQNLMRYFAAALPQMRAAVSTLGSEAALTASYLEIQRTRMGRRLRFEIDIAAPLRDIRLPPMVLLTLVENAIKHGIAPLPQGGDVRVSARTDGGCLRLDVADNGQGFTKASGGGTGLANIRARLAGAYGPAAELSLTLNQPRGVIATIALPLAAAGAPT